MGTGIVDRMRIELSALEVRSELRHLPVVRHCGREIVTGGRHMLNLSSNDYLGLASDDEFRESFWDESDARHLPLSSSSSRLLTGNFEMYGRLEEMLACKYGMPAALVFSSGYHMNTGILPALCDSHTLILADRLVHASLIDGIRLSGAKWIRYRHNDLSQLEELVDRNTGCFDTIIIVTEGVFSMDGDVTDLKRLVTLKRRYSNVLLYVDDAHGVGVRGKKGLGCVEEQNCLGEIDIMAGTFGKALASMGAYIVCDRMIRDYLINRMRTLIFTTALPPLNLLWTEYVVSHLSDLITRRIRLEETSSLLREALKQKGYDCPSQSHIVPLIVGPSGEAVACAAELQRNGFYALPVRPPTVPEGTSRIRFSINASVTREEIERLIDMIGMR